MLLPVLASSLPLSMKRSKALREGFNLTFEWDRPKAACPSI